MYPEMQNCMVHIKVHLSWMQAPWQPYALHILSPPDPKARLCLPHAKSSSYTCWKNEKISDELTETWPLREYKKN